MSHSIEVMSTMKDVREAAQPLYDYLDGLDNCRERSCAKTRLDECVQWLGSYTARKAIETE